MFYFDENVMNDIMSLLNKNVYQVENMENGYLNKMSSISNSGLYGNGIETIDSQITAVKDGFTNFKNITTNNTNKMIELERKLIEEASDIPLPKDWDANDTGYKTTVKESNLSKIDGRSVNDGSGDTSERTMTDYYGNDMTNLDKLKNTELHEDKLKDYEKSKEIGLVDVRSDETEEQHMEDFKETKHDDLTHITKDLNNVNPELDDNYAYTDKDVELDNINDDIQIGDIGLDDINIE